MPIPIRNWLLIIGALALCLLLASTTAAHHGEPQPLDLQPAPFGDQPPTDMKIQWTGPSSADLLWTQISSAPRICIVQARDENLLPRQCFDSAAGARKISITDAAAGDLFYVDEDNPGVKWLGRYGAYVLTSQTGAWSPPLVVGDKWIGATTASINWTQRSDADRVCIRVGEAASSCTASAPGAMRATVEAQRGALIYIAEQRGGLALGEAGPFEIGGPERPFKAYVPIAIRQ